jgi:hypothetical protein
MSIANMQRPMTHEMRKATWSGLDGRAVVRPERRPREAEQVAPATELAGEPAAEPAPLAPAKPLDE